MTAIFIALAPRLCPVAFQPAYRRGNLSRPRAAASMRRSSAIEGAHRPPWATKRSAASTTLAGPSRLSNDGRDGEFHQGPLLPVEDARHEASIAIEAQDVKGGPHDTNGAGGREARPRGRPCAPVPRRSVQGGSFADPAASDRTWRSADDAVRRSHRPGRCGRTIPSRVPRRAWQGRRSPYPADTGVGVPVQSGAIRMRQGWEAGRHARNR